jgi:uncharacterized protein (DUF486 family)
MNRSMKYDGDISLVIGYLLGIGHLATKSNALFILSVCATSLSIINYILQINKNRTK